MNNIATSNGKVPHITLEEKPGILNFGDLLLPYQNSGNLSNERNKVTLGFYLQSSS